MPPKSKTKNAQEIKLVLKRGKQILVILADSNSSLSDLKKEIQEMVNVTGGLKSLDDDDEPDYGNGGADGDDDDDDIDIDIPAPFGQNSDHSDQDFEVYNGAKALNGKKKVQEDSDDEGEGSQGVTNSIRSASDIKIGKPVDKNQPSGTNFTQVGTGDDGTKIVLRELQIEDGDVLAFATANEDFLVIEPVEENDN